MLEWLLWGRTTPPKAKALGEMVARLLSSDNPQAGDKPTLLSEKEVSLAEAPGWLQRRAYRHYRCRRHRLAADCASPGPRPACSSSGSATQPGTPWSRITWVLCWQLFSAASPGPLPPPLSCARLAGSRPPACLPVCLPACREALLKDSTLVEISTSANVIVVGDLHGQFSDLQVGAARPRPPAAGTEWAHAETLRSRRAAAGTPACPHRLPVRAPAATWPLHMWRRTPCRPPPTASSVAARCPTLLQRIFQRLGQPGSDDKIWVFLGDYIDRGECAAASTPPYLPTAGAFAALATLPASGWAGPSSQGPSGSSGVRVASGRFDPNVGASGGYDEDARGGVRGARERLVPGASLSSGPARQPASLRPAPPAPHNTRVCLPPAGPMGLEIVATLFALKLRHPRHIYLLRGNHECSEITVRQAAGWEGGPARGLAINEGGDQ